MAASVKWFLARSQDIAHAPTSQKISRGRTSRSSRRNPTSAATARLARALQTITTLPVIETCDTLLATLAPNPADDIAILMART